MNNSHVNDLVQEASKHQVQPTSRREFANIALDLEDLMREAERLKTLLKPYVLTSGEHQITGGIKAKYNGGSRKLDWDTPARTVDLEIFEANTEYIPEKILPGSYKTNAQAICKAAKLEPVVLKPAVASVEFILLDD